MDDDNRIVIMDDEEAILELAEAVIATFRQLRTAGGKLHGAKGPVTGERGIMLELAGSGPQTVPAMARTRATSRQHVQVIVDRLIADGLLERRANPRHQRSVVIALTRRGRAKVTRMRERERRAARRLAAVLPPAEARRAAATVRRLGLALSAAVGAES